MNWFTTMNTGLLDCMIRPFGQDRVNTIQEPRQEESCRRKTNSVVSLVSEPDHGCLPPPTMQPKVMSRENSNAGSGGLSPPSKSIPISNIKRTASEIQLHEDEALADWRDYVMYSRIVNGMNQKRAMINDSFRRATDQSLANIIRTHNLPIDGEHEPSYEQPYVIPADGFAYPLQMQHLRQYQPRYSITDNGGVVDTDDEERDEGIFVLDDL